MNIIDIINTLTIFQLLSFAVYLLVVNNSRKTSNRFLALFFIIQSTCVLNSIIWRYLEWSIYHIPYFIYIPIILLKLWGPAFYFYVKSMTTPSFRLQFKDLLHTIPMLLFAVLIIFCYNRFSGSLTKELLLHRTILTVSETNIVFILTQILIMCYIIFSLIKLNNHKKEIHTFYSSDDKINLKWLRFIIYGFSGLWLLDTINYSVVLCMGSPTILINFIYPVIFMMAVYAAFQSWKFPNVFIQNDRKPKYEKYPVTEKQKDEYQERLLKIMDEEKLYLIPDLTLKILSDRISIPVVYLSQILNVSIGQNFYDFINSYRIKEAQDYLKNSAVNKMTILEILYRVGFNSKTSFNTAFKKYTGMTPTEYKKINFCERTEVV